MKQNIYQELEQTKNEGNKYFSDLNYDKCIEKYYTVLDRLENIDQEDKITYKNQLFNLEIATRLNLANVKIITREYNIVINECQKVLKIGDNFKAHYRMGVAYYNLKNYEKANEHFIKSKELSEGESIAVINNYISETSKHIKKANLMSKNII